MQLLDFFLNHIEKLINWIKILFAKCKNSKIGQNAINKKHIRDIYQKTKKLINLKMKSDGTITSQKDFDTAFLKFNLVLNEFIMQIYASTECEEQRLSLCSIVPKLDSYGGIYKISFKKFYGSLKKYKKDKTTYDVFYNNLFLLIKSLYDTLTCEQKMLLKSKISVK